MASMNPGVTRVEHADAFVVGGNHLVRNAIGGLLLAWRGNTADAAKER